MKLFRITVITLVVCLVSVLLPGCASESDSTAPENQTIAVQRGNLTVDITAIGNLALSRTEDLAFEIAGTVEEVLVEEGDTVSEGQMLAKLDTSEWEDELESLENQVAAEERDLLQVENNLAQAERNLDQAQYNLDDAEGDLQFTEARYSVDMVSKSTLDLAEQKVVLAEMAVSIAETGVEVAEKNFEAAEQSLEDAREELNEARETSPAITAPFDGFITTVNVEGGDEVMKGTVAVTLAEPNKFEADIMVGEMDILQVKLGGEAWAQIDAMQGLSLPAKVTHVSPTATIQQGVVNYMVKVEVQSLESMMKERQQAMHEAMPEISSGELPERLKQSIEEGLITQEQAEEMMKQRQQEQEGQQGMPTMLPEDFQLREGLTVTVSIIVDERNDVLLVPNGAIIRQGGQTYVQVVPPDGIIEERIITTGISNWQYTEVTDGLNEGEQVIVPQGTTTTPTASQGGRPGMMLPGMGGLH